MFFFHPGDVDFTRLDSVDGLFSFVKQLNDEFTSRAKTSKQTDSLGLLERNIAKGLRFDSDVREQLFRLMVISHARLGDITGDKSHESFLRSTLLPTITSAKRTGLFGLIKIPQQETFPSIETINRAIDSIIYPQQSAKKAVETAIVPVTGESNKEIEVVSQLKTKKLKTLRILINPDYARQIPSMLSYVHQLEAIMLRTSMLDEMNDLEVLIRELQQTNYSTTTHNGWITTDSNGVHYITNKHNIKYDFRIDNLLNHWLSDLLKLRMKFQK